MEIYNYIKDLLFTHDCVIVPGFGGFVANYQHAEVHKYRNTIYPPSKSIMFNQQLKQNDGLLINHVAQQLALDYNNAETKVEEFSASLKKALTENKIIKIPDVGKLYYNTQQTLIFLPELRKNLLTNSFGLKPVTFDLSGEQSSVISAKHETHSSKVVPMSRSKKLSYAGVAASLLLALFISQFMLWDIEPGKFQFNKLPLSTTPSPIDQTSPLPVSHALIDTAQLTNDNLREENSSLTEERDIIEPQENDETSEKSATNNGGYLNNQTPKDLIQKETNQTQTTSGYYLIYGSFKSEVNANELKNKLEVKNKQVKLITAKNGYHRVAVFAGANKSDANTALLSAKSEINSSIWMIHSN